MLTLSIKDYKSETDIVEVQGAVEFDTYKGTARLTGLRGGLDLKTYKGDIRASFARFSAHSHIDTYKDTIELNSAPWLGVRYARRARTAREPRLRFPAHASFRAPPAGNAQHHQRGRPRAAGDLLSREYPAAGGLKRRWAGDLPHCETRGSSFTFNQIRWYPQFLNANCRPDPSQAGRRRAVH